MDSFNNVSPTSSDYISSSGYCYFTNLHPNIELEILKQLEFKEYRNLALTCKRWYRPAVSAHISMKPTLYFNTLDMADACLGRQGKRRKYLDYRRISFKMVKKVNCESLILCTGEDSYGLQRFILDNRSHFKFDSVVVEMDDMNERNYIFIQPLFNLAPEIRWNCYWKNKSFLLRFFEEYLSHKRITINVSDRTACFGLILEQWVARERPHLEYLSYTLSYKATWSEWTSGIEEFVVMDNDAGGRIIVPGLPDLILSRCYRGVEVKRENLPSS